MSEIWKPLPYAPAYDVSDLGRVRSSLIWRGSDEPRLLHPWRNDDGYLVVKIMTPTLGEVPIGVHRLVAHTFLGHQLEGIEVRHLDGNLDHNALTNLAYGTHSLNMLDAVAHRTHNMARRTHCKNGHEFSPENTRPRADGGRRCLACRRERAARRAAA